MMGIAESFLSLGWIVGPLVGGYAAQVAGFAAPFFMTATITFLTVPALMFLMPGGEPLPFHCSQQISPTIHPKAHVVPNTVCMVDSFQCASWMCIRGHTVMRCRQCIVRDVPIRRGGSSAAMHLLASQLTVMIVSGVT